MIGRPFRDQKASPRSTAGQDPARPPAPRRQAAAARCKETIEGEAGQDDPPRPGRQLSWRLARRREARPERPRHDLHRRPADPKANGGNCYACHQIDKKEISFGTIGPSLYQYGKLRGVKDRPDRPRRHRQYTWGKLWNAKRLQRLLEHAALRATGHPHEEQSPRDGPCCSIRSRPSTSKARARERSRGPLITRTQSADHWHEFESREFLQVLASPVVRHGPGRTADPTPPRPKGACTSCRASATSAAAHDRLPRAAAADPLPRTERQPRRRRDGPANCRTWWARRLLKTPASNPGSAAAHAFTFLDFETAARRYGKVGGFAASGQPGQALKASRPGALLLDGGDTWQGSATSPVDQRQDMVDACKLLGVDVMTGHWEFTYGMERVKEIVEKDFKGKVDFVAQNVKTTDFGDPVFKPYVIRPSTACRWPSSARPSPHADRQPALHGGRLELRHPGRQPAEDGRRGARQGRAGGGGAVATTAWTWTSRWPAACAASTPSSAATPTTACRCRCWSSRTPAARPSVTNAGSNSKFLGVIDFEVKGGKVADFRYTLLPVFANQIQPDRRWTR